MTGIYLTLLCSTLHVSAKVYKEQCGSNAYWSYNTKTHVLKISGTGAVTQTIAKSEDSTDAKKLPWSIDKPLKPDKIIFEEGITSLNCPQGLFGSVETYKEDKNHIIKKTKIKIVLPNSLKYIGSSSFVNMNADIEIPKNVKKIAPAAFEIPRDSSDSLYVAKKNPYFCMIDGVLFSKNQTKLIYYPQNKKTKKYVIPKKAKEIAPLAFQNVSSYLEEVILPDGLKKLGSGAFYGCRSLKRINLNNKIKIKSITDYDTSKLPWDYDCIDDDEDLRYLKPAHSTKSVYASGDRAGTFEGTAIQSITIPDSVKFISSNTFFNDTYNRTHTILKKIKFGKHFSGKINLGASQDGMKTLTLNKTGYSSLKIVMPKSNKKYCVQNGILYSKDKTILYLASNYKKKKLEIPSSVKVIANGAFSKNQTIKHITISGDIDSIGYNAFNLSQIKTFTCKGKIKKMGRNTFTDSQLQEVSIREIQEIPIDCFRDCQYLKKADLGSKVQKIGDSAFSGCSLLSSLKIGNQIKHIGTGAFTHCNSLNTEELSKLYTILKKGIIENNSPFRKESLYKRAREQESVKLFL